MNNTIKKILRGLILLCQTLLLIDISIRDEHCVFDWFWNNESQSCVRLHYAWCAYTPLYAGNLGDKSLFCLLAPMTKICVHESIKTAVFEVLLRVSLFSICFVFFNSNYKCITQARSFLAWQNVLFVRVSKLRRKNLLAGTSSLTKSPIMKILLRLILSIQSFKRIKGLLISHCPDFANIQSHDLSSKHWHPSTWCSRWSIFHKLSMIWILLESIWRTFSACAKGLRSVFVWRSRQLGFDL